MITNLTPYEEKLIEENARLRAEIETERIRLAACGVVALANTRKSANKARQMHPDYWSASCSDVINAVDREMKYRERIIFLEAGINRIGGLALQKASHEIIRQIAKETLDYEVSDQGPKST